MFDTPYAKRARDEQREMNSDEQRADRWARLDHQKIQASFDASDDALTFSDDDGPIREDEMTDTTSGEQRMLDRAHEKQVRIAMARLILHSERATNGVMRCIGLLESTLPRAGTPERKRIMDDARERIA